VHAITAKCAKATSKNPNALLNAYPATSANNDLTVEVTLCTACRKGRQQQQQQQQQRPQE
jgi:hypothetical protein